MFEKYATSIKFIFLYKITFNLLKPSGYVMHHQFNIQQLYVLPTLYLCVLYLSENKQSLSLNLSLSLTHSLTHTHTHTHTHTFNLLKPTGHVMHHQFNIQQLYALPTLYLCVLYLSENKQRLVPLAA